VRFLIAIALLFSITPGMSEVAEAAVHLITHADLPHHAAESDHDEGGAEHSCTPLAHHCSCHATMSAQSPSRTATTNELCDVTNIDPSVVVTVAGRSSEPPPLRPPIR
jgi:hypothetical protein